MDATFLKGYLLIFMPNQFNRILSLLFTFDLEVFILNFSVQHKLSQIQSAHRY